MIHTNLFTDFIKKICRKSPVLFSPMQNLLGYDSSRLEIEATSIDWKQLLKTKVDPKYIDILKNFSWVNWITKVKGKDLLILGWNIYC